MKSLGLILSGLLVISASAFAGGDMENMNVENKKAGYSISVPGDWSFDSEQLNGSGELWFNVVTPEEVYVTFYIIPLKGKYDTVKKNIEKEFRKEIFKSFDEMYGKESLKIKVHKKSACTKVNGIELCSAEFNYDYQAEGPQRTYFGVFKTKKGGYCIFFSSNPDTYDGMIDMMKNTVFKSLNLLK